MFSYLDFGLGHALEDVTMGERELQRGYMFQTLAVLHIDRQFNLGLADRAIEAAPEVAARLQSGTVDIATLIDGLRDPEEHPSLNEFVEATKGTNVGRAKAIRFLYLNAAI